MHSDTEAEAVGIRQPCLEELEHHSDRVVPHAVHLPWIGTGQERHHDGHGELGGDLPHLLVLHAVGGVEDGCTRVQRTACHLGTPRVDTHIDTQRGRCGDDRGEAIPLDLPVDDTGNVGGTLPADVDGVGPVVEQLPHPRHRLLRAEHDRIGVQRVGTRIHDTEKLHDPATYTA